MTDQHGEHVAVPVATTTRKRKSNFDVLPDDIMLNSSVVRMGSMIPQMLDIQKQLSILSNFAANAANEAVPFYQSVTEAAFLIKLENALQRNFEYICRYLV
jgi:peptidoglycan hydrolase-like protein with peptidoglycan-binding domain